MTVKTYTVTLAKEGDGVGAIPVPFDPKEVFGKIRAPVVVTLNGYSYRSTIAAMGGPPFVPLRKSHRDAAGLTGGETLEVTLRLDLAERTVEAPSDLVEALKTSPDGWERWAKLSYTHQREHVEAIEGAKKPETRQRRIEAAVAHVAGR
jgi:hypothetical protein